MLLSTIYDQKIIGVVIFGFVMLFQVFLNYIILKMSKNK